MRKMSFGLLQQKIRSTKEAAKPNKAKYLLQNYSIKNDSVSGQWSTCLACMGQWLFYNFLITSPMY